MNKILLILSIFIYCISCSPLKSTTNNPTKNKNLLKEKIWIFIMAGQSNMAGRALIEPQDTLTNSRIFTLGANNTWQAAQEPLHYYEPKLTGLDCGMSFANELLLYIPTDVTIGLVPCAVGGSSVRNWLDDQSYRGVNLLSNFREKVNAARTIGTIKGILWHQGESDNTVDKRKTYLKSIDSLFNQFRLIADNHELPILVGEIGDFNPERKVEDLNTLIRQGTQQDPYRFFVISAGLKDKGDNIHFDSPSIRELGKRYAQSYLTKK